MFQQHTFRNYSLLQTDNNSKGLCPWQEVLLCTARLSVCVCMRTRGEYWSVCVTESRNFIYQTPDTSLKQRQLWENSAERVPSEQNRSDGVQHISGSGFLLIGQHTHTWWESVFPKWIVVLFLHLLIFSCNQNQSCHFSKLKKTNIRRISTCSSNFLHDTLNSNQL